MTSHACVDTLRIKETKIAFSQPNPNQINSLKSVNNKQTTATLRLLIISVKNPTTDSTIQYSIVTFCTSYPEFRN